MKGYQKNIMTSLLCFLLLSGCTGAVEESPTPEASETTSENVPTVTVTARFQQEDDTPLVNETVRISDGKNSMDYPLDEDGAFQVSGIPSSGSFTLSVLKETQEEASIMVHFSTGTVIDATTDSDGVGRVTLKEDTEEVALIFTLKEDGSLSCALQLSQTQALTVSAGSEADGTLSV